MVRFNENNEVIRNEEYTAILAGIQLREDISYSMEELAGLAEADGVTVAGQMIQSLERPNTATLIGKGKVEELAELCRNMEADMVIFNDELSGVQLRNLEEALEVRVIDRTILILDIFADRAVSREGKLQVELAQLQYPYAAADRVRKISLKTRRRDRNERPRRKEAGNRSKTYCGGVSMISRRNWRGSERRGRCSVPEGKNLKYLLLR